MQLGKWGEQSVGPVPRHALVPLTSLLAPGLVTALGTAPVSCSICFGPSEDAANPLRKSPPGVGGENLRRISYDMHRPDHCR